MCKTSAFLICLISCWDPISEEGWRSMTGNHNHDFIFLHIQSLGLKTLLIIFVCLSTGRPSSRKHEWYMPICLHLHCTYLHWLDCLYDECLCTMSTFHLKNLLLASLLKRKLLRWRGTIDLSRKALWVFVGVVFKTSGWWSSIWEIRSDVKRKEIDWGIKQK